MLKLDRRTLLRAVRCRRYRGRHARTEMLPVANSNFTQRRTSMNSQDGLRQRYPMNRRAFVSSLLERLLDRTLLIQMISCHVNEAAKLWRQRRITEIQSVMLERCFGQQPSQL